MEWNRDTINGSCLIKRNIYRQCILNLLLILKQNLCNVFDSIFGKFITCKKNSFDTNSFNFFRLIYICTCRYCIFCVKFIRFLQTRNPFLIKTDQTNLTLF